MIWPPAASAPGPAARAASDVRVGCPGDLLGGLGVERWGECLVDPGQVQGKGQRQSKLREERARKGEEGGGPHHCLCKVRDFFLWEVTMT